MTAKPAPIYLLVDGQADGPHEASEIIERLDPDPDEAGDTPSILDEKTLSCIEGMKRWQPVRETLIYSYAKLLSALPQAENWIRGYADCALNVRDIRGEIRKTLKTAIGLEDWSAPDYILEAIEANGYLLRSIEQYNRRDQTWNVMAMEYYPLMEFVPFDKASYPRWIAAWREAGGIVCHDRIVARIDDPCWRKFSDFDFPLSPFTFGRDGLLNSVTIAEANELGLTFNTGPIKLTELPPFKIVGV